jgi:hypothetical protein
MRLKFGALKVFVFKCKAPIKVLTKSGTNFSHFASTGMNEMIQKAFWAQKGPMFSHNSTLHPF